MRSTATAMIVTAVCAFGHHSLHATYFLDQQVTIAGKVTGFLLRNPHSYLQVEAPDAAGQVLQWAIEWLPAGLLASRGIRSETLKPGDEVTITMSPGLVAADHRGLLRIIRRPSDGFEWGTKPGEVILEWGMARI
jgi:hypothetical protein